MLFLVKIRFFKLLRHVRLKIFDYLSFLFCHLLFLYGEVRLMIRKAKGIIAVSSIQCLN